MRYIKMVAWALTVTLLSGCGGGAGNSLPAAAPEKNAQTTQVKLSFQLGGSAPSAHGRKPQYVSRSTAGIGIRVRATGGSFTGTTATPGAGNVAADVTLGSANCVTGVSPARTCTVLVSAAVGYNDFEITAWDAAPSGGTFSGNQLSTTLVSNQLASQNLINVIPFTLNGVLSSVTLNVNPATLVSGTASVSTLYVTAKDADGNIIIGGAGETYVDSSGNPVTVTVSAIPACTLAAPLCASPGTTVLGSTTFTGPSAASTSVTYNGGTLTSSAFSVTAPILTGNSSATLKFTNATGGLSIPGTPTITEYTPPGAGGGSFGGITSGPDGALWTAESGQKIARITTAGSITEYTVPSTNPSMRGIVGGVDGNIWFNESGTNKIGRFYLGSPLDMPAAPAYSQTPGGTFGALTNYIRITYVNSRGETLASNETFASTSANNVVVVLSPVTSGNATGYNVYASTTQYAEKLQNASPIALGTNWTEPASGLVSLGAIPTANTAAFSEYTVPTLSSNPQGMTLGPDGNIWFAEDSFSTKKVGKINADGTITEYTTGLSGAPFYITAGPDGAVWFTENGARKIGRITTSGKITEFPVPQPPVAITTGSDGNLWFVEGSSGIYNLAKMTTSGTVTQFANGDGCGLTAGPDGALWSTACNLGSGIIRMTTAGVASTFTNGVTGTPAFGITTGADNNIWFVEYNGKIGKLVP